VVENHWSTSTTGKFVNGKFDKSFARQALNYEIKTPQVWYSLMHLGKKTIFTHLSDSQSKLSCSLVKKLVGENQLIRSRTKSKKIIIYNTFY
jgi:hypothetical protein